jgi:hypothetical protein
VNGFKQITAGDRQSVVDIALQEYGCYEGAFLIMQDNAALDLSLHSILIPGVKVLIQTPVPRITADNQGIMELYTQKKTQVVGAGALSYDADGVPTFDPVTIPPSLKPYVSDAYWDAEYAKPTIATTNYADSINLQLENE